MSNKPIFYDSDVLICFLEIDEQEILKKLFSKVIVPEIVYVELNRKNSPQNVKDNLKVLIGEGFVEIEKIEFATPEYYDYTCMIEGYWTNDQPIGFGEAATIALAIKHFGIVASNNLSDIDDLTRLEEIPILTFSMIMSFCFELNLMSKKEIELVWQRILKETNQTLPTKTFNEYYSDLFEHDCSDLSKSYNFKKHYTNSIKGKQAKIQST